MIKNQEVILCDLRLIGSGKAISSPVRSVLEVYTKEGQLIAAHDSLGNYSIEQMHEFAKFCKDNPSCTTEDAFKQWKK